MVQFEQGVQDTNDITMVVSLLQENLALEKLQLNRLSELQEKLAQEPSDLTFLKETISMHLTDQQGLLRSENQLLATRLDAMQIAIVDLGKRMQKFESTGEPKELLASTGVETNLEPAKAAVFEAHLAKVTTDLDQQLQDRFYKLTKDFEEKCISKTQFQDLGKRLAVCEVGGPKTQLEDLERRLAACEGKLTWHLANGQVIQNMAAPLSSSDSSARQPNDSVTSSQGLSQVQSEIQSLREELMPRLQACEVHLSEKSFSQAFEGTMQTELARRIKKPVNAQLEEPKETVALQLSTQEKESRDTFREDSEANSKRLSSYNPLLEKVAMNDKSELNPADGSVISKLRSLMPKSLDEVAAKDTNFGVAKDPEFGIDPPVVTSAADFEANSKRLSSLDTLPDKVAMKDKSELTPADGSVISKLRSLMPKRLDEAAAKDADFGSGSVATSAVTATLVSDPATPKMKYSAESFWKNEQAIQVAEGTSPGSPLQVFSRPQSPQPQRSQQSPLPNSRMSPMQLRRQVDGNGGPAVPVRLASAPPPRRHTLNPHSSFSTIGLAQPYLSASVGTPVHGGPHSRSISPLPYPKLIAPSSGTVYLSSQLPGVSSRTATPDSRGTPPGASSPSRYAAKVVMRGERGS